MKTLGRLAVKTVHAAEDVAAWTVLWFEDWAANWTV